MNRVHPSAFFIGLCTIANLFVLVFANCQSRIVECIRPIVLAIVLRTVATTLPLVVDTKHLVRLSSRGGERRDIRSPRNARAEAKSGFSCCLTIESQCLFFVLFVCLLLLFVCLFVCLPNKATSWWVVQIGWEVHGG